MSSKLTLAHGNPVTGNQFWGRDEDLALFMRHINEGSNLLLLAPRRMGKTSLMREAEIRFKEKYTCLFVDFQTCLDAQEAVVELGKAMYPHRGLLTKVCGIFANVFGGIRDSVESINVSEFGIKLRTGVLKGNWRDKGDQMLDILAGLDKPVLLLLDEVPILVNRLLKGDDFKITPERRGSADEFMSWLRDNALRHAGRLRFVISGSIGLGPVLRQAGLSASINSYQGFELGPWSDEVAIGCLRAFGERYNVHFPDDAPTQIVKTLGYNVPHHIQLFFLEIRDRCMRLKRTDFLSSEVTEVYAEMHGTRGAAQLAHYEERLKLVLSAEAYTLAVDMLSETACMGSLSRSALTAFAGSYTLSEAATTDVQREILEVLQHDGYLRFSSGTYVFMSNLVRDWWRGRHGMFHVPVQERLPLRNV